MTKEVEAYLKDLDLRIQSAVVEKEGDVYKVFVPGAIRENNQVKAESKEEAVEKVRKVLVEKIKSIVPRKGKGSSDGTLEVHDSAHKNKASDLEVDNG